jgi:3-methyladenine DNA glycosylase AlkD
MISTSMVSPSAAQNSSRITLARGFMVMESLETIMQELERKGSEQTRKTYARHGAPASMFGVKVGDLKPIAKRIKGQQELACQLYDTGNSDAMYLAGLVADGSRMSKGQLNKWARQATWYMISEYTVPGVASENSAARELALKWMDAKKESVAACGWCTYAGLVATRPDNELALPEIQQLLERVLHQIGGSSNRVRYCMNSFVIAVGAYIQPLLSIAKATAKQLGPVHVDLGSTACKVPRALESIEKIEAMGRVGNKRKSVKC